jgi:hypothetical protein
MVRSPQTMSVDERCIVAAWAADCAEHVLAIYEACAPADIRVRAAIDQARAFAAGDLPAAEAVRRRGGDAGAAARDAPTPASRAAAYAAEQAVAVAHMGAHAEARRQVAAMTDPVARALSSLPLLGENRSGPLGPGRLSGGHVGAAIRAIQAELALRCHREVS